MIDPAGELPERTHSSIPDCDNNAVRGERTVLPRLQ